MPSLQKAREQARNVVCMSNLRQMGVAWIIYWEDNDYRLYDEYWYWWKPIIKHQKGSADILSCPSMYMYGWFDNCKNWTGYGDRRGGSLYAEWASATGKYVNEVELGYSYNISMAYVSGFTKMTDFRRPAQTGLHAEVASYNWYNRGLFDSTGRYNTGFWFADRHKNGEYTYNSSGVMVGIVRPGRGNVLFLDGHVAGLDTPYPNGMSPFIPNDYDLQNP